MLETFTTAQVGAGRLQQIRHLLDAAFAGEFSDDDWAHTRGGQHVLISDAEVLVAHAAVVPRVLEIDGHPWRAGYVEGVATAPDRQGEGFASAAMEEVARRIHAEFDLGALSTGRHSVYERLGWERWRGPTYVRRETELVRTEDEDDGVMVLRFGPSQGLDLTAAIACEERPGDDW